MNQPADWTADAEPVYRAGGSEAAGKAEICYIDWKAVYTPKDFETSTNKNKKSIKIKALIKSGEGLGAGETLVTEIKLS